MKPINKAVSSGAEGKSEFINSNQCRFEVDYDIQFGWGFSRHHFTVIEPAGLAVSDGSLDAEPVADIARIQTGKITESPDSQPSQQNCKLWFTQHIQGEGAQKMW
ncbi:hypothetical protein [Arthrobacter sp. CAN_A1]|uniref:hypothetical protein n=1 Tax=Arthrobacter sp. CAN_A1 TaxID=2787717 RepID=UPI001A23EDEC